MVGKCYRVSGGEILPHNRVSGGWDKCRKVKYMGGVREVVGISAERSSVWEVHGICMGGGGDKCRKVKCAGGSGISAESG